MRTEPVHLVLSSRTGETVRDAWDMAVTVHPVVDAVSLRFTEETVDRNDGYDIRQDEVWCCEFSERRFARSVDAIDGHGYWWRPLDDDEASRYRLADGYRWAEVGSKQRRHTLNGQPVTDEIVRDALVSNKIGPVRPCDLTIEYTHLDDGVHLACRTCRTKDALGFGPSPEQVVAATQAHKANRAG